MKLQFKHQSFQMDAAMAVCDVFRGQQPRTLTHMIDPGREDTVQQMSLDLESIGYTNAPINISDDTVLENIKDVQRRGNIKQSDSLEPVNGQGCRFNLTIEMETGVGKTYTYIKTMYELNKRYGWSKFIVVVPSVAIREGVYKSFQITEEHFSNDYDGKKIRFFIYNSAPKRLHEITGFASDREINVMIINNQAFNTTGKDARRIDLELDEFNSRKPIDILAKTNPILIIDEPQSVEGPKTKEGLKKFKPLMTLRYSATHKIDSIYNMIYRLDALDAYNKRLVKKIAVKGIKEIGSTAINGYVYLQSVNLSKNKPPTATIALDVKGTNSIHYKKIRVVSKGDDLYAKSEGLEGYGNGYIVKDIDGRDSPSVEFLNGKKLFVGDVIGSVNYEQMHRIQIRETILSHIERERQLFGKGIKVLSLFFIDEVAKYRQYDDSGNAQNGEYANVFEEEYKNIISTMQDELFDTTEYREYLENIKAERTHHGYFSIDKKKDSKLNDKKECTSDDIDAYNLIMKDKERLLDRNADPPVRFIFSHSALREGWDNPNVFQICILKEGKSNVRRRQEVGRGLRLSVNQSGERMDENLLGREGVHNLNVLTVIASESYDDFVRGLQSDIAEAVADDRPVKVDYKLIMDKFNDEKIAYVVHESLIKNEYVAGGKLTEKYYEDRKSGTIVVPEEIKGRVAEVIAVLDSVCDPDANKPENARKNTLETKLNKKNFEKFQELWSRINSKSYYIVKFDDNELVEKSIKTLNAELYIWKDPSFEVEEGEQTKDIESKAQLEKGDAFVRKKAHRSHTIMMPSSSVRYDLIGKIVEETELTRKAVVDILAGLEKDIFDKFRYNPEEFILRAAKLINEQKATVIIEHITYNKLEDRFEEKIFTEPDLKKGCLGVNAMAAERHLYDHVIYDSNIERKFAENLEAHQKEVKVYVKLPRGFYIRTPVGKYRPDWAIAFNEGTVKHIYFVAETKGDMSTMELRKIEESKIECARKHFRAISGDNVVYGVVDSYDSLWKLVHE